MNPINNNVVINFPYSSIEEFEQRQEEFIERALSKILKYSKSELPENLTRRQAANYLGISLSTLDKYAKLSFIKSYRIGKYRILYKRRELDEALKSINTQPKLKSVKNENPST